MKYIFMMAGKGTRLNPLTLHQPKSLFKLDDNTTIFQRMVELICKYDEDASIYAVTGFMHDTIENTVKNEKVHYVYNPFYAVTNSIASLWFAREHMEGDLVLINGDIVLTEELVLFSVNEYSSCHGVGFTRPVNGVSENGLLCPHGEIGVDIDYRSCGKAHFHKVCPP